MNSLPSHRQIINGRTYGRSWNPADYDPIRRYSGSSRIADCVFACVLGVLGAVALVAWWAA